ncbi:hypothetical protein NL676_006307 [Syzygium grande]|nr:hypothetical protein NL676_006307 [Syzygium grande]
MATPTPNYFKNPIVVAKAVLSTVSSVTATVMVVQLATRPFMAPEFQGSLFSEIYGFLSPFSNEMTMVIESFSGYAQNVLFQAAPVSLAGKQMQSLSMRRN